MITRKIGARGQITIPKQIREKKNLEKGDELEVTERGKEIVFRKKVDKEKLKEGYKKNSERDKKLAEEMIAASSEAIAEE